jgi:uncharacterized membrane protein YkgB
MDGPSITILTIWIGQLRFSQYYIQIISRYLKMFPYGDISFIVSVDQINYMTIMNDYIYMVNQRMKPCFIFYFFPFKIHVIFNHGCM